MPEQFKKILDEFGPLSPVGRNRLHIRLIEIVRNDWGRQLLARIETPASRMSSNLRAIQDTADRLLALLGVSKSSDDELVGHPGSRLLGRLGVQIAEVLIEKGAEDPNSHRLLNLIPREGTVVGVVPPWKDGEPRIAVTGGGSLNFVVTMLTALAEGASRARVEAAAAVRRGRGGARREGRTRSSALALELIAVYEEMRRRYPNSGRVPGYSRGGPLSRFVMTVFDAIAANDRTLTSIPEASIRELFYASKKSKDVEY